jgi:hypothetical protein
LSVPGIASAERQKGLEFLGNTDGGHGLDSADFSEL